MDKHVKYYDKDGDGQLNKQEWTHWMVYGNVLTKQPHDSENEFFFNLGDSNNNRSLSSEEIQILLQLFGEEVPLDQIQAAVNYYDDNEDSEINRKEWEDWINEDRHAEKPLIASLLKK